MSGFSRSAFLAVVARTPLVSIDLVARDRDGRILVGRRVNEPARGTWFVPGGRIWKGETLDVAFVRIARSELGAGDWSRDRAPLLGTYTHIYPTNFADVPGIETHYVVLAHRVDVVAPPDLPEEQHSEYLWLRPGELPPVGAIHPNTAVYLDELADGT
ncbi:MAG: GDP-mannose mannosyl hydrolase [Acidimicrobiia bacterium]